MSLLTNLEGYWNFDESSGNPADSSGNLNTLTNVNTTPFTPVRVNNGASFVESNQNSFYRTNADVSAGLHLISDCSFSFWIKLSSQPGTDDSFSIISKGNETDNQRAYQVWYGPIGGVMRIQLGINQKGNGTESDYLYKDYTLSNDTLYHIAITWDASESTATFYVNGSSIGTSVGIRTYINDGTAPLSIGSYDINEYPTLGLMDGKLDELGIWSRVLTTDEISLLSSSASYPFNTPTGGTKTTDGDYTVHTFLLADSGSNMIFYNSGNVKVLAVGGGGGGGGTRDTGAGGGAGGGLVYDASFAVTAQTYTVTVGDGGAGGIAGEGSSTEYGANGANSIFSTITAIGGGGGGSYPANSGRDGGCGGGSSYGEIDVGVGSQGYDGGVGNTGANQPGGGGGGMGAVGGNASATVGGNGGIGLPYDIVEEGTDVYYAGGGGGGTYNGGTAGSGGNGGGGGGGVNAVGTPGADNYGGGGGGAGSLATNRNGGKGGSGIVIIRYLTSDFLGESSGGTNSRLTLLGVGI